VFLRDVIISTLVQTAVLAGVPGLIYFAYHRLRYGRSAREVATRLGLCLGEPRHILHSLAIAGALVSVLAVSRVGTLAADGLALQPFAGRGLTVATAIAALFYGGLQTGFTEELVFRGLIAGSFARRLPPVWANVAQALAFSLVHLPILLVAPEMWGFLAAVFAIALVLGWIRIQSGSIVGPWLIHGVANTAVALMAAAQTVP